MLLRSVHFQRHCVTTEPLQTITANTTPDNCDREPVHLPGFVQPHGVLLVLRPDDLVIVQVTENSAPWLGIAPADLLGQPIETVVGRENADSLRTHAAREPLENDPRYVFSFTPRFSPHPTTGAGPRELDVTAHLADGALVLELEATARSQQKASDIFGLVNGAVARLQATQSLRTFCQTVTEEVARLTGLDRVMVYRFADDDSGWVFAETTAKGLEPLLDLHYPAEDVPKPARDIYNKIWLRPLPDAQAEPVQLIPVVNPHTGKPLDMTYCFLRGASSMYKEYLKNMGVRMSFTMAMHHNGRLWGLIAGHHSEPKVVPHAIRAACEFLAQVVSLQLRAAVERYDAEYAAEIQKRLDRIQSSDLPEPVNASQFFYQTPFLLDYLHAGGSAIRYLGSWKIQGGAPTPAQLDALAIWLASRPANADLVFQTEILSSVYPPAVEMRHVAAGLMAVPLDRARQNWLMWFRPEIIQTVNWAGDPNAKHIVEGPHGPLLMPRSSFALWKETVRGKSEPWLPVELQAVERLRVAVLEVMQQQADRLTRLNHALETSNDELDSFAYVASHDLKEPLRGIFHHGQQLIDTCSGKLDPESQNRLQSLMRLTKRMDTLIDSLLNYSRAGRMELVMLDVDLNDLLNEALDLVAANRRESNTEIRIPRPLPVACCDVVRVRELLVNLIVNAIKYNDKPRRWVEIGFKDEDSRVFFVRDNGIGIAARHHAQIFKIFKRLNGRDEFGGGSGAGLTICKKIVERHGGRIWIESTPGEGSTFFFTLAAGSQT
jgi:light-regulated signal transduction histidine kinase (bacteriophytochrome)